MKFAWVLLFPLVFIAQCGGNFQEKVPGGIIFPELTDDLLRNIKKVFTQHCNTEVFMTSGRNRNYHVVARPCKMVYQYSRRSIDHMPLNESYIYNKQTVHFSKKDYGYCKSYALVKLETTVDKLFISFYYKPQLMQEERCDQKHLNMVFKKAKPIFEKVLDIHLQSMGSK